MAVGFLELIGGAVNGELAELGQVSRCLLYTSDAADDLLCVDLGGRRIIKKKKTHNYYVDPKLVTD